MSALAKAINKLKSGGIIAFPTETVFGLGVLLAKPKAIHRLYRLKQRPKSKPFQILVASLRQAKTLGKFNKEAVRLAKANWPGPMTLVVNKTGGNGKVGLRVPNHRRLLRLIRLVGPLVASSANLAGEPPALSIRELRQQGLKVDYILPGRVRSGKASKVIDTTTGKIIRN